MSLAGFGSVDEANAMMAQTPAGRPGQPDEVLRPVDVPAVFRSQLHQRAGPGHRRRLHRSVGSQLGRRGFAEHRLTIDVAQVHGQLGAVGIDVHLAKELQAREGRQVGLTSGWGFVKKKTTCGPNVLPSRC